MFKAIPPIDLTKSTKALFAATTAGVLNPSAALWHCDCKNRGTARFIAAKVPRISCTVMPPVVSCDATVSTRAYTVCPARTLFSPAAAATTFCAAVIGRSTSSGVSTA